MSKTLRSFFLSFILSLFVWPSAGCIVYIKNNNKQTSVSNTISPESGETHTEPRPASAAGGARAGELEGQNKQRHSELIQYVTHRRRALRMKDTEQPSI